MVDEWSAVAGGYGQRNTLKELNRSQNVSIDADHSVYVSDPGNHCVMKWITGTRGGVVVIGCQDQGNSFKRLRSSEQLVPST